MRLLLAEDERDLNNILAKQLAEEGYGVDACFDGAAAVDYLRAADYDGAILDVMMPKMDGFAVLARIRELGIQTPVLFLTARDSIQDRVQGLDLGASDYLVKPFSMDELMARVRALTRRTSGAQSSVLAVGNLELDEATHVVTCAGRTIDLSAREFSLLAYLMHNAGRVLSRDQIQQHVWNFDYEGGTNAVDVHIHNLRKKIDGTCAADEKLIHTVRGSGYVLRVQEPADSAKGASC